MLILAAMILSSCHSINTTPLRDEVVALPTFLDKYTISGFAVGVGPEPGQFYLLSNQISEVGNENQFRQMLTDSCPAVRAMGLVCLAKHNYSFDILENDKTEILALPFGCGGISMTLEEFSEQLKNDLEFRACYTGPDDFAWEMINK